jgi:hypothetical protein
MAASGTRMDRPEQIRRLIADYRRQLAEGIDGERAIDYLRQIKRLQTELDQIVGDADKRG